MIRRYRIKNKTRDEQKIKEKKNKKESSVSKNVHELKKNVLLTPFICSIVFSFNSLLLSKQQL